ncbi:MAG: iron-sulfur cluster assembly protein [Nitrososphaeria archaeon]|nr:iron-sulfur cluster assembly protein [Nitrososphaeria archaeon]
MEKIEAKMDGESDVRSKIVEILREVYDPEIPINVYDLGLIYGINVDQEGNVEIEMTLTSMGCPLAGITAYRVEEAVKSKIQGVNRVNVKVVWDPPWTPEKITPEGRETLKKIFGYDIVEEWMKFYRR